MARIPVHVPVMTVIGLVMSLVFIYIYFAPFSRLKRWLARKIGKAGGAALNRIQILAEPISAWGW